MLVRARFAVAACHRLDRELYRLKQVLPATPEPDHRRKTSFEYNQTAVQPANCPQSRDRRVGSLIKAPACHGVTAGRHCSLPCRSLRTPGGTADSRAGSHKGARLGRPIFRDRVAASRLGWKDAGALLLLSVGRIRAVGIVADRRDVCRGIR
jgi:hypothetical protein